MPASERPKHNRNKVFLFSGRLLSFVHFTTDGRAVAQRCPAMAEQQRIGSIRAGTTGGMNEEKLDQTDDVPDRGGHGDLALSAC